MIASGRTCAERDYHLASNFPQAAAHARIERIIYLSGLGEASSEHLRSRRELEHGLGSTAIPVTTLRAAMIIGSCSASFEILRYLVARLPVMIIPRWVQTKCQPVAIDDVLYWLVECLQGAKTVGRSLKIGGPDVLSYRQLIQTMARQLELPRRLIFGVPVLTPRLSSAWIRLITSVTYHIARPLAGGLRNRVVVNEDTAQQPVPQMPLHHIVFGGM
jgi:uncharacterized protein YbjT (DUF2867 family)